jgi:hypothetical protein
MYDSLTLSACYTYQGVEIQRDQAQFGGEAVAQVAVLGQQSTLLSELHVREHA